MKITLLVISILGMLLFGSLFSITYGMPEQLENSAKTFIKAKVEEEIREKYQTSPLPSLTEQAAQLTGKLGFEKQQAQTMLDSKLPEKIAQVIASMCGYDCEKQKSIADSISKGYLDKISNLELAQQKLEQLIKGSYLDIVSKLKLDWRVFLGSNFVMFLTLFIISLLKPKAISHLFLPGILLLLSTIISSCIYLFGQDWFYTIIYNDYMGFAYLAYIGVIFAFLMDIVLNRAKITTEIINSILSAIGSGGSISPC